MNPDTVVIARYMRGTVRSKDARGHAQNQIALYERLLPDTTPTIARLTAAAVRAVGAAIASRGCA